MKNLLVIIAAAMFLSCAEDELKEKRTYQITYTDGTTELVTTSDEMKFGKGDCVATCGCFSNEKIKRCGVRKLEEVEVVYVEKEEKPEPLEKIENKRN